MQQMDFHPHSRDVLDGMVLVILAALLRIFSLHYCTLAISLTYIYQLARTTLSPSRIYSDIPVHLLRMH